jgi:hypothetical protein
VSDVRQRELHIAENLVPGSSRLQVEIATEKFKRYKSPGSEQILAELIQAGGETLRSEVHKHVNPTKLADQWKESIIAQI